MKKRRRILLLMLVLLVVLIVLVVIVNSKKGNNIENTNNDIDTTQAAAVQTTSELDRLKGMSEKERIIFYFNKYIENIESGNLDKAYEMLYDEFKNTYFKTIDKYEEYIDEKYPEIIAVNYSNFQRQGVYYIMTLEFQDILNDEAFTQMFVLREYDYNNFVLSFQAE